MNESKRWLVELGNKWSPFLYFDVLFAFVHRQLSCRLVSELSVFLSQIVRDHALFLLFRFVIFGAKRVVSHVTRMKTWFTWAHVHMQMTSIALLLFIVQIRWTVKQRWCHVRFSCFGVDIPYELRGAGLLGAVESLEWGLFASVIANEPWIIFSGFRSGRVGLSSLLLSHYYKISCTRGTHIRRPDLIWRYTGGDPNRWCHASTKTVLRLTASIETWCFDDTQISYTRKNSIRHCCVSAAAYRNANEVESWVF